MGIRFRLAREGLGEEETAACGSVSAERLREVIKFVKGMGGGCVDLCGDRGARVLVAAGKGELRKFVLWRGVRVAVACRIDSTSIALTVNFTREHASFYTVMFRIPCITTKGLTLL